MKVITSIQNPFIKNLLKLQEKARERKKQGLFLIEGKREIELGKKGGYEITSLLFLPTTKNDILLSDFQNVEQILISQEIYDKLAYRKTIAQGNFAPGYCAFQVDFTVFRKIGIH